MSDKQPFLKKRKTFELRLTKFELVHLRDLFGVVLPPEGKKTLSQSLAEVENRSMTETLLWNKISDACELASIPMNEDAPDFIVAPSGPPPISVFQLASEPSDDEDEQSSSFLGNDAGEQK